MTPKTMTGPVLALALASCMGAGPMAGDGGIDDQALEFDGGCTDEQLPLGVVGPCPSIKRSCQTYRAAVAWTAYSMQDCIDDREAVDELVKEEAWSSCSTEIRYDGCMDRCDYHELWMCTLDVLLEVSDCRRTCSPWDITCDDPTWTAAVTCPEPEWENL